MMPHHPGFAADRSQKFRIAQVGLKGPDYPASVIAIRLR
jgi:hypothetical protein